MANYPKTNFWNIEFKDKEHKIFENLIPGWYSEYIDDYCSRKIVCKSPIFESGLHLDICVELVYSKSAADYFKNNSRSCSVYKSDIVDDSSIVASVKIGSGSDSIQKSINCFSIDENGVFLKINSNSGEDMIGELKNLPHYIDLLKSKLIMEAMS